MDVEVKVRDVVGGGVKVAKMSGRKMKVFMVVWMDGWKEGRRGDVVVGVEG